MRGRTSALVFALTTCLAGVSGPVARAGTTVSPPITMAAYATPGDFETWYVEGAAASSCVTPGCESIELVSIYRLWIEGQLVPQFGPTRSLATPGERFRVILPPDAIDFRLEASQTSCLPYTGCGTPASSKWPPFRAVGDETWYPLQPPPL